MTTYRVQCPCGHGVNVKPSYAGKQVRCPKCQKVFRVPPPDASAKPASQSSASTTASDDDPLGLGSDFAAAPSTMRPMPTPRPMTRPTTSPGGSPVQKGAQPGRPVRAGQKSATTKSTSPSQTQASAGLAIGAGFAGVAAGLVVAAIVAGILFATPKGEKYLIVDGSDPMSESIPVASSGPPGTGASSSPSIGSGGVSPVASSDPKPAAPAPDQAGFEETPPPVDSNLAPLEDSPYQLTVAEGDKRLMTFTLPGLAWDASYDRTEGLLAVTNDDAGIVLYDIDYLLAKQDASVRGTIRTQGLPAAVLIKRFGDQCLIIASGMDKPVLDIFELGDLSKPLAEIPLEGCDFANVLASADDPKDPYVYYITKSSTPGGAGNKRLGRVSLESMVNEGMTGESSDRIGDVAVSADGSLLYHRNSQYEFMASRWTGRRDADGSILLKSVSSQRYGINTGYVPDPTGNSVAAGTQQLSRNLWNSGPVSDFQVKAIFDDRPLMFGFTEDAQLAVGSANTAKSFRTVKLPSLTLPTDTKESPRSREAQATFATQLATAFADGQRQLGVALLHDHVIVVPLHELRIPKEFDLRAPELLPTRAFAGRTLSYDLGLAGDHFSIEIENQRERNKSFAEALTTSGRSESVQLNQGRLTWTPKSIDKPKRSIRFRSTWGNVTRDWFWDLEASQPGIELPFNATGFAFDQTGDGGVAWGVDSSPNDPNAKSYIARVNLSLMSVGPAIALPARIVEAQYGGSSIYAFVAASEGDTTTPTEILEIDRQTLAVNRQLTAAEPISDLEILGNRILIAYGAKAQPYAFALPELQPIESNTFVQTGRVHKLNGHSGSGVLWQGVIYDAAFENPQLLVLPIEFQRVNINATFDMPEKFEQSDARLKKEAGDKLTKEEARLAAKPSAAILLNRGGPRYSQVGQNKRLEGYQLPTHSARLKAGAGSILVETFQRRAQTRIEQITDEDEYSIKVTGQGGGSGYIGAKNGRIVTLFGGDLQITPLEQLNLKPERFNFEQRQSTFVLEFGKTNKVSYTDLGPSSYDLYLQFDSISSEPFLTTVSDNGEFSFKLDAKGFPEIAKRKVRSLAGGLDQDSINAFMDRVSGPFERLTGRAPKGIPIPIKATVSATNGSDIAGMFHHYLVEVPIKDVIE